MDKLGDYGHINIELSRVELNYRCCYKKEVLFSY